MMSSASSQTCDYMVQTLSHDKVDDANVGISQRKLFNGKYKLYYFNFVNDMHYVC